MFKNKQLAILAILAMIAPMVLGACGPTPAPEVVEKVVTQVVTQTVKETVKETVIVAGTPQVVEKEVTKVVEVPKEVTAVPQVVSFDKAPDPTTLTYAMPDDAADLDPHLAYEGTSYEIIINVVEPLIFFNRDSASEFVPVLATEVPSVQNGGISADGTVYTFKIRQGVKFHNGNDFTASDAAYSWERVLLQSDPNSGAWMMIESIMGYSSGDITEKIADGAYAGDQTELIANASPDDLRAVCEEVKSHFEADDASGTFKVTLPQPWGPLLEIIARPWAYMIDKEWAAEVGDWDGSCDTWQNYYAPGQEATKLGKVINGTGPYKLDHWTPGVEWVLTANEDYWRQDGDPVWPDGPSGAPRIQRIVHKTVPEWGTRFAMLQTGDVAFAEVPSANRPQADAWVGETCDYATDTCQPTDNPDMPLRMWPNEPNPSRTDIFLNFNVRTDESGGNPYIGSGKMDGNGIRPDFFSDLDVRKGFSYCFDYDTYIMDGQNGEGVRNTSMIITNMLGYNPDQEMYNYDPQKCEEELAKAWGGTLPDTGFRLQAVVPTGYPMNQTAAAILQSDLRAVNPKYQVEIVSLPWASYLASFRAGLLPIAISGWTEDYHDPHNWAQPFLVGTYATRQNFPDDFKDIFRPLIEQAVAEPDAAKRAELYYELGALRYENVPEINLSQQGNREYTQRWVKDYYYNPVTQGEWYFYAWDLAGRE
jgi:peptide/nickel transport system substrate-binding protein